MDIEKNIIEDLYAIGSNASHREFWDLFMDYKFGITPELDHFKIAFGDDEGVSYFYQTKKLVNDFWNAVTACATFDGDCQDILFEINNPEEYARRPKDSTSELFELFFAGMDSYEKEKKEKESIRSEMKNMISKFGVEKTKIALYNAFDKYLRDVLEHIGVDQIDEIASNIKYDSCYFNMEDLDEGFEEEHDLKLLANFVKENILPQLNDED